jgi:hypothetical protein
MLEKSIAATGKSCYKQSSKCSRDLRAENKQKQEVQAKGPQGNSGDSRGWDGTKEEKAEDDTTHEANATDETWTTDQRFLPSARDRMQRWRTWRRTG